MAKTTKHTPLNLNDSLWLYEGKVMHARIKPVEHRFNYRVFNILIDIDQLSAADQKASLFSVEKWNLLSFKQKDHGNRDGSSLRPYIDDLMERGGIERPNRVLFLCYPRVLGYTFNPLSVYYCYNNQNELMALVYQVHNTFGERHTYVEPVFDTQVSKAGIRQDTDKLFYVSPFMDMEMRYSFRMSEPGSSIRQRILETDLDGPILSATLSARKIPTTNAYFLRALLQTMGLTWKVTLGIHWEALKLWVKGMKLRSKPSPPSPESYSVESKNRSADMQDSGSLPALGE